MGLDPSTETKGPTGESFSNDVLKVDILGPDKDHLSVIDVPGIFRVPREGQTSHADIELVKAMTFSYMKNERSIILTVVQANTDLATQEITGYAKRYDPAGRRTLGILTKPDLVDNGGEPAVIDIIEGRAYPLNLGWCVVKNAGQSALEKSFAERQQDEEIFFKTEEPWNKLSRDKVGVSFLRSRLVEILRDLVNREFSKVIQGEGHSW